MRIILSLLLAAISVAASSHPWKSNHYVIIDTDCGLDDFRAINLLLASPDIRVLAITLSNGVLDAENGYKKVKSLLHATHQEGILVGINFGSGISHTPCVPALQMEWGTPGGSFTAPADAKEVIQYVFDNCTEPITLVCLGSLNTAGIAAGQCPGFDRKVKYIVWSGCLQNKEGNFNYELDKSSADQVISGGVPVCMVYSSSIKQYSDPWITSLMDSPIPYAQSIARSLAQNTTPFSRAFFDESVPLFLNFPDLFKADTINTLVGYDVAASVSVSDVMKAYLSILRDETGNRNQVLSLFPLDSAFYQNDVKPLLSTALEKYGKEEFVACVLANEMHRHLGVYAVIGVKMGIRAMEYFGAGIDEMRVISYAGVTPPFSCMNDGLQISTGATLGHGLITIASDTLMLPQADFIYMNRRLRVSLKPEFRQRVESEVRDLRGIYGISSNIYWDLVRQEAISIWESFSRYEVFTVEML